MDEVNNMAGKVGEVIGAIVRPALESIPIGPFCIGVPKNVAFVRGCGGRED